MMKGPLEARADNTGQVKSHGLSSGQEQEGLTPYMSAAGAWALALGTSIGWSCLVVTASEYLAKAGPLGSVMGMMIGATLMMVVAKNVVFMVRTCPEGGGVYTFVKKVFGYDRAFLIAWFETLTYLALLLSNATSIPFFARFFVGDVFCWVRLFSFLGYDIYLGELLLTLAVLLLVTLLCMRGGRPLLFVILLSVLAICIGITAVFLGVFLGSPSSTGPSFVPGESPVREVIRITFISPWAFVGFEGISHSSKEYSFQVKKLPAILYSSILVSALLYVFVFLFSVRAYPPEYASWLAYFQNLGEQSGIMQLPAFYAAYTYMGKGGIALLFIALAGLVLSSLVGNLLALSRLFYVLAKDKVIPERFGHLGRWKTPDQAFLLILLLGTAFVWAGRTAVNWIVDLGTVGALLMYGFICGATLRLSRKGKAYARSVGAAFGLVMIVIFAFYFLLEGFMENIGIGRESQVILIVWAILGLIYFRLVMIRDHGRRFGKNVTVWIVLAAFIFLFSMKWICEECSIISARTLMEVRNLYSDGSSIEELIEDPALLSYQQDMLRMIWESALGVVGIFLVTVGALISNWFYVRRCEVEMARELGTVKDIAYKDGLTGVKSRYAFWERERAVDELIREGGMVPFAVAIFDVNGLKYVNDTYGHKRGDLYLLSAVEMICDIFPETEIFRVGGDEFAAVLIGEEHEKLSSLARTFDQRVEENIHQDGVVISLGFAEYEKGQDESVQMVYDRADQKMYERKMRLKAMGAVTRE